MYKLSHFAVLGLALTACGDKDDSGDDIDTTGNGYVYVPTEIETVTYSYDAAGWDYVVDLNGWADSVSMYITQNTENPWEEDHVLERIGSDPNGSWDMWEINLPITTEWDQQESSVNTLFAGNPDTEATMAWRIDAYEDGICVGCVVWAGSSSTVSIVNDGCIEITF